MANSKRRENFTDKNGNMLIPINVEGGQYNEHFMTTPKLVCIAMIICAFCYIIYVSTHPMAPLITWIVRLGLWLFVTTLIVRFIIFEEKFYYRMYLELKDNEITTPAMFWNIASIKDTDEGALITYADAKIGIMVKVDRDTITGKTPDFKETHYDAISDFYRDVVTQKYNFVQMNIMEQAGKDPRLAELSKVVYKSDNPNIQKLMEMEVGHIKNITHTSLYESDYFLFYTTDVTKMETIIGDITESIFKLLDGAYISYKILSSKEITDLVKEEYGVNYFNSTEASLVMYSNNVNSTINPFNITGIVWANGEEQTLNNREISKLRNITSSVIKETISLKDVSLKKAIYRKDDKNKVGVDFNSLSKSTRRRPIQQNKNQQIQNNKTQQIDNTNNIGYNQQNNVDNYEQQNYNMQYNQQNNNAEYQYNNQQDIMQFNEQSYQDNIDYTQQDYTQYNQDQQYYNNTYNTNSQQFTNNNNISDSDDEEYIDL